MNVLHSIRSFTEHSGSGPACKQKRYKPVCELVLHQMTLRMNLNQILLLGQNQPKVANLKQQLRLQELLKINTLLNCEVDRLTLQKTEEENHLECSVMYLNAKYYRCTMLDYWPVSNMPIC